MLKISAFRGFRFDSRGVSLSRAICPPYDVISPDLERALKRAPENAAYIELPSGKGDQRYLNALHTWQRWLKRAVVIQDREPAFYVVEQRFQWGGKWFRRKGVLAALGLDTSSARRVLPHEKTLSKPKKDRTRLLKTLQVNTSPIFGLFSDPSGAIRGHLRKSTQQPPLAMGKDVHGTRVRLWRIHDPKEVSAIERAFETKSLLIADGHHRYEVARQYWRKTGRAGAGAILAYLCAEQDPGLIVLPTHRVLRLTEAMQRNLAASCLKYSQSSLAALEKALGHAGSPYAFGLYDGKFHLMLPRCGIGVRSGFGTDWLAQRIFKDVDAQSMRYFHDSAQAVKEARQRHEAAFIAKPFPVAAIREAVERVGLLPQKSTYFYPKINTGLVFRALAEN